MLLYAGIYLAGAFLGFWAAALTKGKDRLWDDDMERWLPVLMTFLWPSAIVILIIMMFLIVLIESPKLFFWLMSKAADVIESARNWKISKKRIVVPAPAPSVVQEYRQPGPHPCIACGTPTSVDQSCMECVELVEAQQSRLDI